MSEHTLDEIRVLSWNVNGLRSCAKKGFKKWLDASGGTIVGVQEVRAERDQLPTELTDPSGWETHFASAERKGYSGVGIFARRAPDGVETELGVKRFDCEGRVQIARFGRLAVANVYFPNGKGKERDNSRVPYKLAFYRKLFERPEPLRRGGLRVVVMGDFNTAHTELDLARPKQNREISGFLPKECREVSRWLDAGWVDTFRHFEKDGGHYSWWSQRAGVRAKNIGWRIDYVLASPAAMKFVRRAFINKDVMGSDHCPVGVDLDARILG
jgi:exodeoxyribonuclease-3